jgi:hypothetical protein
MNLLKFRYLQNNVIAVLLLFYNNNFVVWELKQLRSCSMLFMKETIKYFYDKCYFHSHNNVWPREKHNFKQWSGNWLTYLSNRGDQN